MFCNPPPDAAAADATPTLRRLVERRKTMKDEQHIQPLDQDPKGAYEPDAVQIQAVRDSIAFFDTYLKA